MPRLHLACRDNYLAATGQADCWQALESIGAEGVEAAIGDDLSLPGLFYPGGHYTVATPAGIARLRADMKAAGKRITAFCMNNSFDTRPDFEVEWVTRAAEAARQLEIKAIRIDVIRRDTPPEEFLNVMAGILRRVMADIKSTGVALGIENHGGTTNDPEFLAPLFERVGSNRLGLTLDTANFYWFGHPLSKLYEIYERFASRIFHTHCKTIHYPESEREKQRPMGWEYGKYNCPLDEGDIDFRRVLQILRATNYANDLCVENESLGKYPAAERSAIIARDIRFLKECL